MQKARTKALRAEPCIGGAKTMNCEMCGERQGQFYKGTVEGVSMTLCSGCKKLGENSVAIQEPSHEQPKAAAQTLQRAQRHQRQEIIQIITSDYDQRIKKAREREGLKQEELAQQLSEKASLIQSMEGGRHEPSIELARKLERRLHIKLVKEHKEQGIPSVSSNSGPMTIADLIKKR